MALRIKICGITREEDAWAAIEAGADALGFVFVPGTPRFIEPGRAAAITRSLPPFVSRVGLFVNADPEHIRATVAEARLDTVQLHGDEPPEVGLSLLGPVRVIQAFRVQGPETLQRLPTSESPPMLGSWMRTSRERPAEPVRASIGTSLCRPGNSDTP